MDGYTAAGADLGSQGLWVGWNQDGTGWTLSDDPADMPTSITRRRDFGDGWKCSRRRWTPKWGSGEVPLPGGAVLGLVRFSRPFSPGFKGPRCRMDTGRACSVPSRVGSRAGDGRRRGGGRSPAFWSRARVGFELFSPERRTLGGGVRVPAG